MSLLIFVGLLNLNFPQFDFSSRMDEQKKLIFDRVRKKFIPLTPEEWVRQHCIDFLIDYFNLSPNLIAVERQIKVDGKPKRFDIVSFSTKGTPQILIECKAPDTPISAKTLTQAGLYLSKIDSEYMWLTNGLQHIWMLKSEGKFSVIEFPKTIG
jgi:hypothetical protein